MQRLGLETALAPLLLVAACNAPATLDGPAGGKQDDPAGTSRTSLHLAADCSFGSLATLPSDYTELVMDIDLKSGAVTVDCPEDPDGCSLGGSGPVSWNLYATTTTNDAEPVVSSDPDATTVRKIIIGGGNRDDLDYTVLLQPSRNESGELAAQAVLLVSDGELISEASPVVGCTLELVEESN